MRGEVRGKRTLFLGLGNPILSDDAVGIRVVELIRDTVGKPSGVDFETASFGGLHIIDAIRGYDRVVIVDSTVRGGEPGTLYRLTLDDLDGTTRLASPHRINLKAAIELGRRMEGNSIPDDITIYAVEAKELTRFSEKLSPELEEKLSEIAKTIIENELGGTR